MRIALTRTPGPGLGECELAYISPKPINTDLAAQQHAEYERALRELGVRVVPLPPAPGLPDAVFVEDIAVVLDEVAIIAHPGAESRRGEVESVRTALAGYRPLERFHPPGTLDGGDVLRVGRTFYVGMSGRTNREGAAQLARLVAAHGYLVETVEVSGCLHLKTGCTYLGRDADGAPTLLANPLWVDTTRFGALEILPVDPGEPWAANTLAVGGALLMSGGYPSTRELLERRGFRPFPVDISELEKAEAGVTCLSILLR